MIGNGDYTSLTHLSTPAADATAVAQRLAQMGYEVALGVNRNREQMAELLTGFYTKAQGASVALFYYSGHGMQIEGRNYLLPDRRGLHQRSVLPRRRRARLRPAEIHRRLLDGADQRRLRGRLPRRPAAGKEHRLVPVQGRNGSVTKGLAVVQRESLNSGQFVGFAAEPGKTAETGTGEISVYTQALLKELQTPGLDVSIMHRRIRADVEAATNGRQSPRYVDDLTDTFALNPGLMRSTMAALFRVRASRLLSRRRHARLRRAPPVSACRGETSLPAARRRSRVCSSRDPGRGPRPQPKIETPARAARCVGPAGQARL